MFLRFTRRGCTIFRLRSVRINTRRSALARLFGFGALLVSSYSYSSDGTSVTLSIKPKVCVLSSAEEICQDELQISWLSASERSLCLYQKNHPVPLACWESANKGSHNMALNTSTSLNFLLRESAQDELLASETFEVIHDHKQYRRARRNAWAFF